MLPERHTSIIGHSKCGGGVCIGDGCVVECDCGLFGVFLVPGCVSVVRSVVVE